MSGSAKAQLLPLTGLRFVAAWLVVVYHFGQPLAAHQPAWLLSIVQHGYVGVGLFFVLSGFILTYIYTGAGPTAELSRARFWTARLARVYPLYLVSLAAAAPPVVARGLVGGASASTTPGSLLSGLPVLLMVQAWHPATATAWNIPAWSLSVEACFYALFPFLIRPLLRLRPRQLAGVALAAWGAGLVAPLAYLLLEPDGVHVTGPLSVAEEGFWLAAVKYHPLLHLHEFVLGIAAGRVFLSARLRAPVGHARPRPAGAVVATALVALAILLILASGSALPYLLLHNGLLAPLFAALIYGLAASRTGLAAALSGAWLVRLGEASYAVYLLQAPLMTYARVVVGVVSGRGLARDAHLLSGDVGFLAAYGVGLIALALLLQRYVEAPARNWLRRALAGSPGDRSPGVPLAGERGKSA